VQSFRSALPLHIKGVHMGVCIRSAVSERVCPLSYVTAGDAGSTLVVRWYRCCGEAWCYMQPLYSGFGTERCGQFQGEPLPEMANNVLWHGSDCFISRLQGKYTSTLVRRYPESFREFFQEFFLESFRELRAFLFSPSARRSLKKFINTPPALAFFCAKC